LSNSILGKVIQLARSLSGRAGSKLDSRESYSRCLRSLRRRHSNDEAVRLAVGGEFDAFGILERETLIQYGLKEDAYVIDVGCGSGRLAKPLSEYLRGPYLGIDVIPGLVKYARTLVPRPDWRFEVSNGLTIPEKDAKADFVCFFSVFTHLLHEQSYIYLQEAKRVLKPDGKILFTFLDFTIPDHWRMFESSLADVNGTGPLNVFLSKEAIRIWASRLDLAVEVIQDGDKPSIPLTQPVILEDGRVLEDVATLGQSLCVLKRMG